MTALFMDGFDNYGSGTAGANNMLEGEWAQVGFGPGTPVWGARTGTYALQNSGFITANRYVLPAAKDKVFVSFGFSCDGLPTSTTNYLCDFRDNSNAMMVIVYVTSTGTLEVRNSVNSVIGTTQGPVIVSRNWHLIEMEFDKVGGNFIVRVDDSTGAGTPAINLTGLTIASQCAQMTFNGAPVSSGEISTWIDDIFIRDGLGTVNNSWLGDRRIATLLVDGDTTTAGWTANRYAKLGLGILNLTPGTTTNGSTVSAATATALNIGASDFTQETFIRFKSLPTGSNKSVIFSRWDQTNNQRSYQLFLGSQTLNGGSLCWQTSTDGTNATVTQSIVYPWIPDLDTWYHLAIVRASNQLLLFVNGQQFGLPIADATTYFAGTSQWSLGTEVDMISGFPTPQANTNLNGWLDETRFTNGFARYTSNFTPTTVPFIRGVSDPQWADVVFLAGYDSLIQDESGFARSLNIINGAVQQTPNDGVSVGVWPVIGKSVPDDNTFIEAPFVPATSTLTLTVNPGNGNTVTVGTKNGSIAAVYTFKTALASAFDILIDVSIQQTLQNLFNAINAGPGAGTKYGTSTTANFDVFATQLPAGQMQVTANTPGTGGNSIASTSSGITGGWTSTHLAGGLNIPGPSNFKVQRLPPQTTLVSAVQVQMRAFKSDAGVGTINSALIGALGGVATASAHSLTVSPAYYNDIFEVDPDTSGPISPTTITNGAIQVNRDT